jgi:hypothetical protein
MSAKGKVNASQVQRGDRIIAIVNRETGYVFPSSTKTGDLVEIVRVTSKVKHSSQRGYVIRTSAGSFYAEPIQTMWLAPEDAAGIKRAHAEARVEQADRWRAGLDEIWDEALAENEKRNAGTGLPEVVCGKYTGRASNRCLLAAGHSTPCDDDPDTEIGDPRQWATEGTEYPYRGGLTLHSHDGKVDNMSDETATRTQPAFPNDNRSPVQGQQVMTGQPVVPATVTGDTTGSAVVSLLEDVWDRIRQNHPELPAVVMITGSGLVGASKWGHFRANGWKIKQEGAATSTRLHEMFMAGETLAKGANQVLQTMLHEGAHTLARVRDISDTSRQGRWHNTEFRKLATELGLDHKGTSADKTHGYSYVTLTQATKDAYADLLAELDREIRLMCDLPAWMGGSSDEDEEGNGGEKITGKPTSGKTHSGSLKLTCECDEPNIIRASKTTADKLVVRCDDCEQLFSTKN